MPNVYNRYHDKSKNPEYHTPLGAVYIGRGSPYGNPFMIGIHGNRDQVCDQFETMVESNPELKAKIKKELKGKDLICYCKPARCHGDYLLKIANED